VWVRQAGERQLLGLPPITLYGYNTDVQDDRRSVRESIRVTKRLSYVAHPRSGDVRDVPKEDLRPVSFDHLVGGGEQHGRHGNT